MLLSARTIWSQTYNNLRVVENFSHSSKTRFQFKFGQLPVPVAAAELCCIYQGSEQGQLVSCLMLGTMPPPLSAWSVSPCFAAILKYGMPVNLLKAGGWQTAGGQEQVEVNKIHSLADILFSIVS